MRYKISPSMLNEWRLTRLGAYNKEKDSLIEYFSRKYEPNENTSRGSAYHEMLEHGPEKYKQEGKDGGFYYAVHEPEFDRTWHFSEDAVRPIRVIRENNPRMIYESWTFKDLKIGQDTIRVRCRIDGLNGLHMHEFKTTKRAPKGNTPEGTGYLDSIQHKCYMMILKRVRTCNYQIFQLNARNTTCKHTTYKYLRTGKEEEEVRIELEGLMSWLHHHPELLKTLEF